MSASAYEGDAVGLKLNAGAVADTLWNTGSISASVTGDTAVTAKAVSIAAGAVHDQHHQRRDHQRHGRPAKAARPTPSSTRAAG
jgi:hypothetical protein